MLFVLFTKKITAAARRICHSAGKTNCVFLHAHMSEENKPKKRLTPNQAYLKAQATCAYQERCQQEMRDKFYEWGLHENDVENLIAKLISDGFLNEERFAITYAGGKFRIKKWGRIKIKLELKRRKISDYCIRKAMAAIDDNAYMAALKEILAKKLKENPKGKLQVRNYKAAQYAASRGYESDLIWDCLKEERNESVD
jgi:regulatory protein